MKTLFVSKLIEVGGGAREWSVEVKVGELVLTLSSLPSEERPDVDAAYMSFIQATSGRGGWPLSAFLTSEGEPL